MTDVLIGKGVGIALEGLKQIKPIATLLTKLDDLKSLAKVKVAETFSDEAAQLAKQKFANRLKQLNLSPNSITNIAADPELWARASQIVGNTVSKGYTKFADFSKQVVKELGDIAKPQLKKLYRESLISLDLNKGRQVLSSSGKVIDEAVVREAKEKVFDLVNNNKPLELEEFLEGRNGIRNKYGSEFVDELKQTRDKFVDNLSETTRRTVDTHDLLGGHIREEHIGRSENWLRNRLDKPEMRDENFASSLNTTKKKMKNGWKVL